MVTDEEFQDLRAKVDATHEKLDIILDTLTKAETAIRTVIAEVKPTLDAIMNSPFGKIFAGKKK